MRKPFAYSKKVFLSKKKQVLCLQPLPQITASLPGLNQPPLPENEPATRKWQ
jgi:hypothetical protein